MTLGGILTDDGGSENEFCVPVELKQKLPRRIGLASKGAYYLVGSMIISVSIFAFVVADISTTAKVVRNGRELARDGHLALTSDVQAGGMHLATVYYSFTFNGELYRGKAFLPNRYLNQISGYRKSGDFPVLFLPRDPSINHPSNWRDDESLSFISYLFIALLIIQWSVLARFILQDLRLARNGVVAIGRVTNCSQGRSGGVRLKYEFRDLDGLLTVGTGEYPARRKQDAQICVLYLPEESRRSRPYPIVFFRAVK